MLDHEHVHHQHERNSEPDTRDDEHNGSAHHCKYFQNSDPHKRPEPSDRRFIRCVHSRGVMEGKDNRQHTENKDDVPDKNDQSAQNGKWESEIEKNIPQRDDERRQKDDLNEHLPALFIKVP